MDDNDGVGLNRRNSLDKLVALMPCGEVVAVSGVAVDGDVALAAVGLEEDDGGVNADALVANLLGLLEVEVVKCPRKGCAIFHGATLQGLVG